MREPKRITRALNSLRALDLQRLKAHGMRDLPLRQPTLGRRLACWIGLHDWHRMGKWRPEEQCLSCGVHRPTMRRLGQPL